MLRAMTDNVLLEVEKTFDFFKATASSDHIDRIVLSGGASRVEGFTEALRERFDTQVELLRSVPPGHVRRQAAGRQPRGDGAARRRRARSRAATGGRPMIRINLVAGERRAAKAAGRSFQIGQKITVAGSLILVVDGAAASAGATGRSARTRPQLTRDIDAARREEVAPRRGPEAGRRLRSRSARSCSSASRSSTSCAAARRRPCT